MNKKGSSETWVSSLEDHDLINAVEIFLGPDQQAIIIRYTFEYSFYSEY